MFIYDYINKYKNENLLKYFVLFVQSTLMRDSRT